MLKRSFYVKAGLLITAVLIIFLLVNMGQIILPFIFAGILAYLLLPLADWLLAKKIPLIFIVIGIYLFFAIILYFAVFWALPLLYGQLGSIFAGLPSVFDKVLAALQQTKLPESLIVDLRTLSGSIGNMGGDTDWLKGLGRAGEFLLALLIAPMLSYYILKDRQQFKEWVLCLLPPRHRPEICRITADINRIFRSFFSGYILLAIIVAALSFLFFFFLKVPYALLLALLLGVCDLIPYLGPLIGAIPAVVIAFMQKPLLALWVIIGIFIIQQLESSVLSPRILGSRIGLNPLTVIFAVLFGGKYFGLLGMLFALPAAASLKLLISYAYCRISEAKAAKNDYTF